MAATLTACWLPLHVVAAIHQPVTAIHQPTVAIPSCCRTSGVHQAAATGVSAD